MAKICFYFQLHQPYRLSNFSIFDIDGEQSYFTDSSKNVNKEIFHKVAQKSYIPMLSLLLELVQSVPEFVFSISCSGVFLEQAQEYEPEVISLLQQLVETGQVELLSETYYHSLASLYSPQEFREQVFLHKKLLKKLFAVEPKVFRNTELIYSNDIAAQVAKLGFLGMLTEGVDRYLHGRSRAQVFRSASKPSLLLLLKHAQLSDDVAFRFSDKNWPEHPLSSEKYLDWFHVFMKNEVVNLFMDFETFGEHQWADTGIFEFFRHFIYQVARHPDHTFVTPTQVFSKILHQPKNLRPHFPMYDVPEPISWADIDRDLTAWRGNSLQNDALRLVYEVEKHIFSCNDTELLEDWRRLQTSDHFYYMCVKWSADGDVHKYFSPYDSPFDAYNRYTTVFADVMSRVLQHKKKRKKLKNSFVLKESLLTS